MFFKRRLKFVTKIIFFTILTKKYNSFKTLHEFLLSSINNIIFKYDSSCDNAKYIVEVR